MFRYLLFLLLMPVAGFSQNFIGKSKASVMKHLQQQQTRNDSLAITLIHTDSTITYKVPAGKTQAADFVYEFGPDGKCRMEKVRASCDSCFKKYLQRALDQKKYKWKKINDNQYVSKYSKRRMIELPAEGNDFSFTILRTGWSKKLYAILMN